MHASRRQSGLAIGLAGSAVLHALATAWLWERAAPGAVAPSAPQRSLAVRIVAAPPAPVEAPEPPEPAPPEPAPIVPPKPPQPAPAPEPTSVAPPEPASVAPPAPDASEPAPVAAAAPPAVAPELAAAPLPPVEAGPSPEELLARYEAELRQRIAAHKRYPSLARRRGVEGTVRLVLSIDPDGRLTAVQSPGRAPLVLARAARRAAEQAAPFAPPPDGAFRVELSLVFDLDD